MAVAGRRYTVAFSGVSVSAVQDLIIVFCGASKIIAPVEVRLGQITNTAQQNLRVRLRYLPVTVTTGSGGGAGTIGRLVSGDAAATVTARINDTVQATTNGTAVELCSDVWNTLQGFFWIPSPLTYPPIIGLSGAFVVSLDTAPASAMTSSGSVTFEELP